MISLGILLIVVKLILTEFTRFKIIFFIFCLISIFICLSRSILDIQSSLCCISSPLNPATRWNHPNDTTLWFLLAVRNRRYSEPFFSLCFLHERNQVSLWNQKTKLPPYPFSSRSLLDTNHIVPKSKLDPILLNEPHLLKHNDLSLAVALFSYDLALDSETPNLSVNRSDSTYFPNIIG